MSTAVETIKNKVKSSSIISKEHLFFLRFIRPQPQTVIVYEQDNAVLFALLLKYWQRTNIRIVNDQVPPVSVQSKRVEYYSNLADAFEGADPKSTVILYMGTFHYQQNHAESNRRLSELLRYSPKSIVIDDYLGWSYARGDEEKSVKSDVNKIINRKDFVHELSAFHSRHKNITEKSGHLHHFLIKKSQPYGFTRDLDIDCMSVIPDHLINLALRSRYEVEVLYRYIDTALKHSTQEETGIQITRPSHFRMLLSSG